jgi:hypothetical protein
LETDRNFGVDRGKMVSFFFFHTGMMGKLGPEYPMEVANPALKNEVFSLPASHGGFAGYVPENCWDLDLSFLS